MNQVLLYSINPEHLANILNGHKTIEVRKRDLPQWAKDKLARGEKVVGYGYCTKGGKALSQRFKDSKGIEMYYDIFHDRRLPYMKILNGLVVVKFEVSGSDKISYEEIVTDNFGLDETRYEYMTNKLDEAELLEKLYLTPYELYDYINLGKSYAHHLTNIQPIEPMEVGEFQTRYLIEETLKWYGEFDYVYQPLIKAPQSFMTAWVKE